MTKKQEHWLVALCSLLYFTSYFTRKNFAAVMVEMISIGLFDKESAGMVVSALFITYGAGQILSGFLGDRFSPSHLIVCGLVPILLVIVLQGYLRDGIDAWLPTFFSEVFSQGSASSVLASVVLPIFAILSVYAAGALHRRFLRNEVVGALFFFALSLIVSLPLLLCMEWGHPAASVISLISVALFSGSMHALNFMLISCLPARFVRYGRAATTSGICNAATYIGSATASYGIALTANTLGWKATALSWLGIAALGLLACLLALRPYTRFLNKKEG